MLAPLYKLAKLDKLIVEILDISYIFNAVSLDVVDKSPRDYSG
jgi:hypothetical protein